MSESAKTDPRQIMFRDHAMTVSPNRPNGITEMMLPLRAYRDRPSPLDGRAIPTQTTAHG